MYENHIEYCDKPGNMLQPKLIVTKSRRPSVCNYRRRQQPKGAACKRPKVNDIKQGFVFGNEHKGGEYNSPPANGDRQVVDGVCI